MTKILHARVDFTIPTLKRLPAIGIGISFGFENGSETAIKAIL